MKSNHALSFVQGCLKEAQVFNSSKIQTDKQKCEEFIGTRVLLLLFKAGIFKHKRTNLLHCSTLFESTSGT